MRSALRSIAAVVVGFIAASIVMMIIEAINGMVVVVPAAASGRPRHSRARSRLPRPLHNRIRWQDGLKNALEGNFLPRISTHFRLW